MKYLLLGALGLAGLTAACQQQAPATQAAAPAATAPAAPTSPAAPATEKPLPVLFAAADTLTPPMRELLRHQNLAPLWLLADDEAENFGGRAMEGFFGPEHYHFSLVLTRAARDAADPAVYHVAGKARYFPSHGIRPFAGTLTVRRVADLPYPGFLAARARSTERAADSLQGRTYAARARLQLQEATAANSGTFEGEALLDFYVVPGQRPARVYVFDHEGSDDRLPTRGGALLLRGSRRNVTTGQVKPFAVSPSLGAVAPLVFQDFLLDERMGEINPKYKHLGWNELWVNDEWWADGPATSASARN